MKDIIRKIFHNEPIKQVTLSPAERGVFETDFEAFCDSLVIEGIDHVAGSTALTDRITNYRTETQITEVVLWLDCQTTIFGNIPFSSPARLCHNYYVPNFNEEEQTVKTIQGSDQYALLAHAVLTFLG